MDITKTPIRVKRALRKLGEDIWDARRRGYLPVKLVAARAGISRSTLSRIEKGDEGVGIVAYAKVLFVLGMIERLGDLADAKWDKIGLVLEAEKLPKRIRLPHEKRGE